MTTEKITIANLSCGGCVNTITKKLTALVGVDSVAVDLTDSLVTVNVNNETGRAELTKTLMSLGYPEATEKNGLLTQIKSIQSCLTGKLSS